MIDHDKNVGEMLDYLDELGIADNTFVMYSTDNGPHMNSWPDGGMTPFRSEKDTNWEGAFRVPLLVRWPGKIPAGVVSNDIVQHHDWLPTFCAMAGDADIAEKLLKGHKAGDKTFKVHIDGYNLLALPDRARRRRARARASSTSTTTAISSRCASTTGRSCSWSSATQGTLQTLGGAVHRPAHPEALQSAHRSVRARRHHVEHLLGLVPVQGLHDHGGAGARPASSWRRSRSIRRGRRRRRSRSIRRWRRWRSPSTAVTESTTLAARSSNESGGAATASCSDDPDPASPAFTRQPRSAIRQAPSVAQRPPGATEPMVNRRAGGKDRVEVQVLT